MARRAARARAPARGPRAVPRDLHELALHAHAGLAPRERRLDLGGPRGEQLLLGLAAPRREVAAEAVEVRAPAEVAEERRRVRRHLADARGDLARADDAAHVPVRGDIHDGPLSFL